MPRRLGFLDGMSRARSHSEPIVCRETEDFSTKDHKNLTSYLTQLGLWVILYLALEELDDLERNRRPACTFSNHDFGTERNDDAP